MWSSSRARAGSLALVLFLTSMASSEACFGQDILAKHKINGLKGLRSVAIVFRGNTPREYASPKEWADIVEVALRRDMPELKRADVEKAPAWLELSLVTTDQGSLVEVCLYRWVKVLDSGEELFSRVWWDSRILFGAGISKKDLHDSVESLVTAFAADYSRTKS